MNNSLTRTKVKALYRISPGVISHVFGLVEYVPNALTGASVMRQLLRVVSDSHPKALMLSNLASVMTIDEKEPLKFSLDHSAIKRAHLFNTLYDKSFYDLFTMIAVLYPGYTSFSISAWAPNPFPASEVQGIILSILECPVIESSFISKQDAATLVDVLFA